MKLVPLALVPLLALACAAPAADAWLPVCWEKSAGAAGTTVTVHITCGPGVSVTRCPPVGEGPCTAIDVLP